MTDLFNNFKDKIRSPIFGNFIFSWMIWNWKIPYITFFVNEKYINHINKLTYIEIIIDGYGSDFCKFGHLLLGPIISTTIIVSCYPFIYNIIKKIHIYFSYELKKFYEEKGKDYKSNTLKLEELNRTYNEYIDLTRKELAYNIIENDIELKQIFIGTWNVEIISNNDHQTFNCSLVGNKFINNTKGAIIEFESLDVIPSENTDVHNFRGTVNLNNDKFLNGVESMQFIIRNRAHIELYNSGNSRKTIILKLISIN